MGQHSEQNALVPEREDDLFMRLKELQRQMEFLDIQEEYIKDEMKNLKREMIRAQEEIKRVQSVPLVIGQFSEMVDQNRGIVSSTTGSNYFVRILSTLNRELLKPSSSVALHRHSHAVVDILPPEADSTVQSLAMSEKPDVTYADVGGMDIQKQEIKEAVELPLTNVELYAQIGIDAPSGVLLYGPPGTGKTMLAKAVANQTTATFIRMVGSEFVQKYLGEGPRMVRDVFRLARENAPAIVFIDEIDAIGRQRGSGMGGGNDEREQTLNQILTEMDGFEGNSGVIVVAATNRSDILDSALLRPGRFDRRVQVDLPDVKGREQILNVHLRNKKLDEEISVGEVAKRCAGMSGADLENLMNESAILAARRKKKSISMEDINDATDRVVAGLEGRALADDAQKKLFAYHEAGKALVGSLLPYHDPVAKMTLLPRGQKKSLTWFSPDQDQSLISAASLKARIAGFLGGRAAEQIVFGTGQVTTNAAEDLKRVDQVARAMVTQVGMSSVGQIAIDQGGMMGPSYSEDLAAKIDVAIKELSDEGYLTALKIVVNNRACLDKLADELYEKETLDGAAIKQIISEFTEIPEKLAAV
mmetsp:Transcript_128244/g.344108  ORF Transcript_128244/g.344108 Transcript_128244/m.344108 type:complete len:588 (-) Transcript_128244:327-2090(-)